MTCSPVGFGTECVTCLFVYIGAKPCPPGRAHEAVLFPRLWRVFLWRPQRGTWCRVYINGHIPSKFMCPRLELFLLLMHTCLSGTCSSCAAISVVINAVSCVAAPSDAAPRASTAISRRSGPSQTSIADATPPAPTPAPAQQPRCEACEVSSSPIINMTFLI